MEYGLLNTCDIKDSLFEHFVRRQLVTQCWRKVEGEWVVMDISFVDDWSKEDYERILSRLQHISASGGAVYGAFENRRLKGLAAVKATLFGRGGEYLDLTDIYVSQEARGLGIGRVLFGLAKVWAKAHGARKLYISAHSSIESQAFYRAMGCVEAKEYDLEHVRQEPFDCQLECEL